MVMKSGEVVETGTVEQIYASPAQDYTRKLLDAIPVPVPRAARQA
jgi:ABC-type dipeptide/oligopeptide/nickel transport system ATPase component